MVPLVFIAKPNPFDPEKHSPIITRAPIVLPQCLAVTDRRIPPSLSRHGAMAADDEKHCRITE
jgi:hypothetical protein